MTEVPMPLLFCSVDERKKHMPGINFDQLRKEISIEEVLSLIGFEQTSRSGNQLRGPCPVHGSTSSSSRTF